MATVKRGTLTSATCFTAFWRHLRRPGKRAFWKRERKAVKKFIKHEVES